VAVSRFGRPAPLHPAGSARLAFLASVEAGTAAGEDDPLPPSLWLSLRGRDVDDGTLYLAWEIAALAPAATPAERRALGRLAVSILEAARAGSTCIDLPSETAGLLHTGLFEHAGAGRTEGVMNSPAATTAARRGDRRPFVIDGGRLYLERYWAAEERLAAALRSRIGTNDRAGLAPVATLDAALAEAAEVGPGRKLTDEQSRAVRAALERPLTLIAGGPGTGKTTLVVSLVRALLLLDVPPEAVALAAPTGRAAQRLGAAVAAALGPALAARLPGACTIHRLLGVQGRTVAAGIERNERFHHAGWPLPHRVVVVDEASMIDLFLMDELVSALAPDARLVLLGDADQLPSVEAGAVFRDLCAAAPLEPVRLRASHRLSAADAAGADILRAATALRAGALAADDLPRRQLVADLRHEGIERLDASLLPAFLDDWYARLMGDHPELAAAAAREHAVDGAGRIVDPAAGAAALLAAHAAARLLCVTRSSGRASDAQAINDALTARAAQSQAAATLDPGWVGFVPGQPVLMLRNDYRRGLYNGDPGIVLRVRRARGRPLLAAAFARPDGRVVAYALDELRGDVGPAYALTVHKAQGSELDRVAIVLPDGDLPLLSREVLYTALTRARRSVVVIGDPALIALAAGRPLVRSSGLDRKVGSAPR
jgi:exodeoxyribonuclease V alpha subunit